MVYQYPFNRFLQMRPLKQKSALEIVSVRIFSIFSIPKILQSDDSWEFKIVVTVGLSLLSDGLIFQWYMDFRDIHNNGHLFYYLLFSHLSFRIFSLFISNLIMLINLLVISKLTVSIKRRIENNAHYLDEKKFH